MNACLFSRNSSPARAQRTVALAVWLLIAAPLLLGGALWTARAAPAAQGTPPVRLPYDAPFDAPHRAGAASLGERSTALTAPEYASWSKLVFQSARNEQDWEVYSAAGDGSDQVNLSNDGAMDVHPRLDRAAARLAFASDRHGNFDIFVANADGSVQTRLTDDGADDVSPAWSPDGGRLAFQAYRDGQAEIYLMNADGSGQARLTSHDDYDGQPAWSPDGSQIAFVRRASGEYHIWAMNADGSNQRPLSNQPYSEGPAWSPDGSQIAYDCDGDGDGWQEIWLMDAGGGNQRQVYDPPESYTDAWVRSWSPDGRYMAFTRIAWTYYQGQWYWTVAYLDAWDSAEPWNTIRLSSTGADWHPDWQSLDHQAPDSSVQALPAQSPAEFTLSWAGTDAGGSGLKSYDVQVKDGSTGAWSDLRSNSTETSASFRGVGGHTYYFRSRGRDNAGNLEAWPADHDTATTVEARAPKTSVRPLPAFSRNTIVINWGGSDPGGSGIESYDVQYRQGSGAWTDWRMGVAETSAAFSGAAGFEYRFRARARDRAQNLEAWPGMADATMTLYTWAIAGKASDNRGAPVVGMAVSTAPAAFHTAPSNGYGGYAAHVSVAAASYSASWSKTGYGALPTTPSSPTLDAAIDVVLPPADNVVQNWGFENGSSSWQFAGSLTAAVTDTVQHTGASAAFLGSVARPLRSVTALPDGPSVPQGFSAAVDAAGAINLVWGGQQVMVSRKLPTGPWEPPTPISTPAVHGGTAPILQIDGAGTMHVLWYSLADTLYYVQKPAAGGWSAQEGIPGASSPSGTGMAVTDVGSAMVAWCGPGGVRVSERNTNGVWTGAQNISATAPGCHDAIKIAIDPAGLAHVLWWPLAPNTGLFYAAETSPGAWLPPANLLAASYAINDAEMAVDAQGKVDVVWAFGEGVYYRSRPVGGQWSPAECVSTNRATDLSMAVDGLSTVHVAWIEFSPSNPAAPRPIMYSRRTDSTWSPPINISQPSEELSNWRLDMVVDHSHTAHVVWLDTHAGSAFEVIRYTTQIAPGRWLPPVEVAAPALYGGRGPKLVVDGSGTPHAFWQAFLANVYPIRYAGPEPAPMAGEAFMSQAVTVPSAVQAPTLSFWHRFGTEFSSNSRLDAVIDDGIAPTVVFSATAGNNTWAHQWADLTPWAGRTITLRFRVVEEAGGARASAYIDEVSVGSANPDLWVSQPERRGARPGQRVTLALSYGNRGGVAADQGQVTLQLPAELAFVSADPPPAATSPSLRWDVGALAAQSGLQTIRVTLQVAGSAVRGVTLNTTAGITSGVAEIEQANNTAAGSILVGSLDYLPVILR